MPEELTIIPWAGGEMPVAPETVVYVVLRNGNAITLPACASEYRWENHPDPRNTQFDIVGYVIVPQSTLVEEHHGKEKN